MDETAGIGVCPTATGSVTGGRSIVLVDGEPVDERGTPIATASGAPERSRSATPADVSEESPREAS